MLYMALSRLSCLQGGNPLKGLQNPWFTKSLVSIVAYACRLRLSLTLYATPLGPIEAN